MKQQQQQQQQHNSNTNVTPCASLLEISDVVLLASTGQPP
jgi:hypothetical protein